MTAIPVTIKQAMAFSALTMRPGISTPDDLCELAAQAERAAVLTPSGDIVELVWKMRVLSEWLDAHGDKDDATGDAETMQAIAVLWADLGLLIRKNA